PEGTPMPRRLLSAAAAGALLLGIAACGDQTDEPVTTAPPSIDVAGPSDDGGDSSPSDGGGSETTEPTAQAPDIPPPDPADFAGMAGHTPEGAEQAFRYYIAVSMWAHQTGNDAPLSELESGIAKAVHFSTKTSRRYKSLASTGRSSRLTIPAQQYITQASLSMRSDTYLA